MFTNQQTCWGQNSFLLLFWWISPRIIILHIYTAFGYVSDDDEKLAVEELAVIDDDDPMMMTTQPLVEDDREKVPPVSR